MEIYLATFGILVHVHVLGAYGISSPESNKAVNVLPCSYAEPEMTFSEITIRPWDIGMANHRLSYDFHGCDLSWGSPWSNLKWSSITGR